jgi:hypothetical protein
MSCMQAKLPNLQRGVLYHALTAATVQDVALFGGAVVVVALVPHTQCVVFCVTHAASSVLGCGYYGLC